MDDVWNDRWPGLYISKYIDVLVPMLPLDTEDLQQIFAVKMKKYSDEFAGIRWRDLVVDKALIANFTAFPYFEFQDFERDDGTMQPFSTRGARPYFSGESNNAVLLCSDIPARKFPHLSCTIFRTLSCSDFTN